MLHLVVHPECVALTLCADLSSVSVDPRVDSNANEYVVNSETHTAEGESEFLLQQRLFPELVGRFSAS